MIKAKQTFLCSYNLEGYGFHGNKATILIWPRYIVSAVWKTLFSWNQTSASKVMVI